MVINCPVCGKLTCIHWPEHWVHRRGPTYYCSDNCLQVDLVKDTKLLNSSLKRRGRKMKAILNEEQRKHAVEIALSGGDPRPFLTDCGSKCPEKLWGSIKASVRENDPETFKKLPAKIRGAKPGPKPKTAGDAMNAMKEAADHFFGECDRLLGKDEPEQIETPEGPKIRVPLMYDNFAVTAVKGLFGEYRRVITGIGDYIDFEPVQSDTVLSLTVNQWPEFIKELRTAAQVLGVELDV